MFFTIVPSEHLCPDLRPLQVIKTLNERISGYCAVTLETMAYAGTGDVLKVQKMLAIAGEHIEVEEGEAWKVNCHPPFVSANLFVLEYASSYTIL